MAHAKGLTRRYSQHVCLSRSVLTHSPRQAHVWLIFDVRQKMCALRFFTLPTLLGWLAAFLTCALVHFASHLSEFGPPNRSVDLLVKDYALAMAVGGLVIVVPTYVFVILPLSATAFRSGRISSRIYLVAILFVGAAMTAVFAKQDITDIGWASSRSVQILLFYTPFVPYAVVVAFAAKHFFPNDRKA